MSSYEWLIGTRHLRSTHRRGFVSFVALMSVCGLALGVATLIVVLSVMNGFERELRNRILSVTSHATISGLRGPIGDWQALQRAAAPAAGRAGGRALHREPGDVRARSEDGRRQRARRPAGRGAHRHRARAAPHCGQPRGAAQRLLRDHPRWRAGARAQRAASATASSSSPPRARRRRPAWCRACGAFASWACSSRGCTSSTAGSRW